MLALSQTLPHTLTSLPTSFRLSQSRLVFYPSSSYPRVLPSSRIYSYFLSLSLCSLSQPLPSFYQSIITFFQLLFAFSSYSFSFLRFSHSYPVSSSSFGPLQRLPAYSKLLSVNSTFFQLLSAYFAFASLFLTLSHSFLLFSSSSGVFFSVSLHLPIFYQSILPFFQLLFAFFSFAFSFLSFFSLIFTLSFLFRCF